MKEVKDPCYQITKKVKTVLYTDGMIEDFPLIKKTREQIIELITQARLQKYNSLTKEELIEKLMRKNAVRIESTKNDDLEDLVDKLVGFGHIINEPCPYNGIHCSFGDINGLV
jgi:hypothetical protein